MKVDTTTHGEQERRTAIVEALNAVVRTYSETLDGAIDCANAEGMEAVAALVNEYGLDAVRDATNSVENIASPETPVLSHVCQML